jgi:hypothetical protein
VVLTIPVDGAPFWLETNASNLLAGTVLHQLIDGKAWLNRFYLGTFNDVEQNYDIYDKKLLAIINHEGIRILAQRATWNPTLWDLDWPQESRVLTLQHSRLTRCQTYQNTTSNSSTALANST